MKNILKYIFTLSLCVFIYFAYSKSKSYIANIYSTNMNESNNKEFLDIYLTSDNTLVSLEKEKIKNLEIKKGNTTVNENDIIVLEKLLIDDYINLLNYMASNNYKKNNHAQNLAYKIVFFKMNYEQDRNKILFQSYSDLISNNTIKNSIRVISTDDIKLIKKDNLYFINIGQIIINIVLELEKLLIKYEEKNINTKAERNFLNTINGIK